MNIVAVPNSAGGSAHSETWTLLQPGEEERIRHNAEYAMNVIKMERGRRVQAEQQLQRMQSKPAVVSLPRGGGDHPIIGPALRSIHDDVGVLMSEMVERVRSSGTRAETLSLVELLDIAVTALENAAGMPAESVVTNDSAPVMDVEEEVKSTWCCCFS